MRCISSEGVDLSELPHGQPSHPQHVCHVTTPTTDVITPDAPISVTPAMKPHVTADVSSSSSSLQLSPVSATSDLPQRDSPMLKNFPAMSSVSSRFAHPPQFSSMSTPELSTLPASYSQQCSFGASSSTFSLSVGGDWESGSSRASTAKNTLSSGSSLNTGPDDLSCSAASSENGLSLNGSLPLLESPEGSKIAGPVQRDGTVPDPTRRHRQLETVVQKQNRGRDQEKISSIQLPERYRHMLRKSGSHGNIGSFGNKGSYSDKGQDLTSREKDLGTALAWIRHEMVQMKEQDKLLLKRFIELRASILHLRCMYGSTSDICSMDGSSISLNEARKPMRLRSTESDVMLSGRLYMTSSTLSLPCSPQMSRLRWRSDEFM